MKFQADAHVSVEMVEMIRGLGHDCADAATIPPRMPDVDILRRAAREGRIVVTVDKDFGELIFAYAIPSPGVILLRVSLADEADRVAFVRSIWETALSRLPGSFVTVGMPGVRARPIIPT